MMRLKKLAPFSDQFYYPKTMQQALVEPWMKAWQSCILCIYVCVCVCAWLVVATKQYRKRFRGVVFVVVNNYFESFNKLYVCVCCTNTLTIKYSCLYVCTCIKDFLSILRLGVVACFRKCGVVALTTLAICRSYYSVLKICYL